MYPEVITIVFSFIYISDSDLFCIFASQFVFEFNL